MPNRLSLFSLLVLLGLLSAAQPASGQALVPHTVELDVDQLEQRGLILAQEAAQLAQFQQYELALPRAQLATQLAPGDAQVWALLGSLYVQTEKLDEGITALQQARSLDQNNAPVWFALGSAYFRQEKYAEAVEHLRSGLRIKPDTPGALFDLGNTYYKMSRFREAIAEYEKAVAQDRSFWPAVNNIGLVMYEMGNVDGAIEQWQRAIDIAGNEAEPQLATAVALYAKGDREQGLTVGAAALEIDSRYADVEFLRENLWGDRLLAEAERFLETPRIREAIAQLQS